MFTNYLKFIIPICLTYIYATAGYAAGLLKPANSPLPDLQIKQHHVDVVIENGYVTTSVEQTFHNPNSSVLEAIYSFPLPEQAAVGEFTYWINGQPVVGEVVKKEQARQIYEAQKAQGKHTALVEKDSYKTFDITVYPIQPNSDVRIRLVYLQVANLDSGVGRYVYPLEDGGVDEEKQSFWERNETVTESFSFNFTFRSAYPVDAMRFPQHPHATITQINDKEWQASLVNSAQHNSSSVSSGDDDMNTHLPSDSESNAQVIAPSIIKLNQDILVYWRHLENTPASLDLVTYKEQENSKGTFMFTLVPGDDLAPIYEGSDWIFVLDVSGSMQGKYATLVEGVRQALGKLRIQDRFKVVLFNNGSHELTHGYTNVDRASIENILNQLQQYTVGGGTNLYAGLQTGVAHLDADRPTGVILVTDGVANVGTTEKKAFLKLLEKYDVRLFSFVMGNSANRPLLNEMTRISNGFSVSVSNADDIVGRILLATSKLTHQAFREVEFKIKGIRTSDVTPDQIGSLYRGEQLTLLGNYWHGGEAIIELTANVGGEEKKYSTKVMFQNVDMRNPELERIWAFATVDNLQKKLDYLGDDSDTKNALVDIALDHSLVTNHTSMVVVEEKIYEELNIDRKNKARVKKENDAREKRKTESVANNRADSQQPMFNSNRPTSSRSGGGGAFDIIAIAALLLLVLSRAGWLRQKLNRKP